MTAAAAKAALRRAARQARAGCAAAAPDASDRIAERALSSIEFPPGAVVAGYAAIGDEIDAIPLLRLLAAARVCALPRVETGDTLTFRRWSPDTMLVPGPYGVPAPPEGAPEATPDIVLVPLLAFDREGYRLGYGGGYYDKALAELRRTRSVLAVGLAYAGQEVARVPRDLWDQPLDLVVTERRLISFGDKDVKR